MLQKSTKIQIKGDRELEKPSTQFEIFMSGFQDDDGAMGKCKKI